jgi:hypothetical protein
MVPPMKDFEENSGEISSHLHTINKKVRSAAKKNENDGLSQAAGMGHQYQMAMTLKKKGAPPHPRQADLVASYTERIQTARASMEGEDIYKTYTAEELAPLMKIANRLGMDDKVLVDMLYIGSRKKKFREVDALIAQMLNWRDFPVRKYPFKFFSSKEEYAEFTQFVRGLLQGSKFENAEVRIMGSSLRSNKAGDIDMSVVVDQQGFDLHLQAIRDSMNLGADDEDPGAVKVARRAGFMKLALTPVVKQIQSQYPKLKVQAIGMTLLGGPFDLQPALAI